MVWFQCEDCGDNLKKPKLPGHFNSCPASKLSCLDCGVVFDKRTVQFHTSCISEVEKYGPKGDGKVLTSTPKNSAQKKPADDGTDISMGLSTHPPWKCSLCNVNTTSQENLQLHAEGKKHRAKARAVARKEAENQGAALKKGGGDGESEGAAKGSGNAESEGGVKQLEEATNGNDGGGDGECEGAAKGSGNGESEGAVEQLEEATNGDDGGVNCQESVKSKKKRARDGQEERTGTEEVRKTTDESENPAAGAGEENGQKKKKKKKNKDKKGAADDKDAGEPMIIDGKEEDGGSSRGGTDSTGSKDEKREESKQEETDGKDIGEKGEGGGEAWVKSPVANGAGSEISPETSDKKKKKKKKKKKRKMPSSNEVEGDNKNAGVKSPAANGGGAEVLLETSNEKQKKKNKKNKKRKKPSSNEAAGDGENNGKNGGEAQQETPEGKDNVKKRSGHTDADVKQEKASGTELGKGGSTENEKELVEDDRQEDGEQKKKKRRKKGRKEDGDGMDAKAKESNAEQPHLLSEGKWCDVLKMAFKDAPDGLSLKKLQKSALPLALQQAEKGTKEDDLRAELIKQIHRNRQYAVDGKMVHVVAT